MRTTRHLLTSFLLALFVLFLAAEPAMAQRDNSEVRASPNAMLSQTIGTTVVNMHYSRPGVKGRTIFGGLAPWDQVWRAGANEPTTVMFEDDVLIEGEPLPAGTYNIFIEPHEEGPWDFIVHEVVGWGTMYDPEKEILRVQVMPEEAPTQEWLAYSFEDLSDDAATLQMHWANTMLPVRVEVAGQ